MKKLLVCLLLVLSAFLFTGCKDGSNVVVGILQTAALDPKTAKIVLDITEQIVNKNKISTLIITHNMRDAIKYGDRLIMLDAGKIVLDISGEEKKNSTIEDLLKKFDENTDIVVDDKLVLSK